MILDYLYFHASAGVLLAILFYVRNLRNLGRLIHVTLAVGIVVMWPAWIITESVEYVQMRRARRAAERGDS